MGVSGRANEPWGGLPFFVWQEGQALRNGAAGFSVPRRIVGSESKDHGRGATSVP